MSFEYDAFISYSRGDRTFAAKLEVALEHYKVPKDVGATVRHLQVFRDEQDMVGSDYYESISEFLNASKKLIVICSPRAAASKFVDMEVEHFIEHRGFEHVVPVLIDGKPDNEATANEERAFPPALTDAREMPLAIRYDGIDLDRQKLDRNDFSDAWYTLLASLLDVSRSEIERRARKRRQAVIRNVILGLVLFSGAMGGLAIYAFMQQQIAEEQTKIAKAQRDAALVTQSLFLADLSQQQTREGNAVNGMLLALEALPESIASPNRPYVIEAEGALFAAVAANRERGFLAGHEGRVTFAEFSPDGTKILTASHDRTARIWHRNGTLVAVLEGHDGRVAHAAFSGDGRHIATVDMKGKVGLWRQDGQFVTWLDGGDRTLYHVHFSVNGDRLVTAGYSDIDGGNARIWDVDSRKQYRVLRSPAQARFAISNARFSGDGRYVIAGDRDRAAVVYDVQSGAEQVLLDHAPAGTYAAHDLAVDVMQPTVGAGLYYVTFSPDSKLALTASADQTARLWEIPSGRLLHVLDDHEGKVFHAEFSHDGTQVVSVGADGIGRLWDTRTGRNIRALRGHTDEIRHAAFSKDDRFIVTSSRDDTVRVWSTESGDQQHVLKAHVADVTHSDFSPNGELVVSTGDRTPRIWNLSSDLVTVLTGHDSSLATVDISSDGGRALTAPGGWVTADSNEAWLWDANSGRRIAALTHRGKVTHAAFSPDGMRVVTSSRDRTARVWDGRTGELIAEVPHVGGVGWAVFGRSSEQIVTAAGNLWSTPQTVRVIDVKTKRDVSRHQLHQAMVGYVAARPRHSQIASSSGNERTTRIWDVVEQREVVELKGEVLPVYSNDGKLLATHRSGAVLIRDGHQDTGMRVIDARSRVNAVTFSPDGSLIAIAYFDGVVGVYRTIDGTQLHQLEGHRDEVNHVAFSPDGMRLVSGSGKMEYTANARDLKIAHSEDDSVRVWDVASGKQIVQLSDHSGRIRYVGFTPDGKSVVTGSEDRTARISRLFESTQSLIDAANASLPRQLTASERQAFFLEGSLED